MNAIALALPTPLPAAALPAAAAPAMDMPAAPAAGLRLLAQTCVAQTADLLRLACRRGQLEDASAAARVALPLAQPHTPHAAMLQALAAAQPVLMTAPEERRLYMVRSADGVSHGVVRMRDSGRVALHTPPGIDHWRLRGGNLELTDAAGHASARFMLCGDRNGLRLYLGERLADGQPCMLEEVRCTFTRLNMLDPELLDPFVSLYGSADMVPAPLPARATLLLGQAHTRIDALAQALNQHSGVQIDGALLHPQGVQLDERLHSRSAARNLHAMRAKDGAWFTRMVLGRSHDALGRDLAAMDVRGFCMAPGHDQATLAWALGEPTLRVVHVARSNLLASFADILAEPQLDTGARLHFEPERFSRFVDMTQRQLDALRTRLRQRNGDTVEVDGSRLNAATVAELLGFLTDTSHPACDAVPASGQRVVERFDNPEAVLACLQSLGCAGWAEVEGQVPDSGQVSETGR